MQRKLSPFLLLFLLLVFESFGQTNHRTGLVMDDERYMAAHQILTGLSFAEPPNSYSLKLYCPPPGNQGDIGSCVGWATGYAALTMTNKYYDAYAVGPFSPLFIYNQIKVSGCDGGARLDDALELMKNKGDCKISDFSPSSCNTSPSADIEKIAAQNKIKDYYRLFSTNATTEEKISKTINSIAANKPVIIGMNLKESFENLRYPGFYSPSVDEENLGGHALCVIGYDKTSKKFEIINSWGSQWGNEGYFSISFDDYAKYTKYGFQFTYEPIKSNTVKISGNFLFKRFNYFRPADSQYIYDFTNVSLADNIYRISDGPCKINTFYKIFANNLTANSYVYVFSQKPNKDVELLFPKQKGSKLDDGIFGVEEGDLPVIPSDKTFIEIPKDKRKGLVTSQVGKDYLCILYSDKKIENINEILNNFKNIDGDFITRLVSSFGSRLIPFNRIKYSGNEMSVSAESNLGYIAPIILAVEVAN